MTLQDLIDQVIKSKLSFNEPTLVFFSLSLITIILFLSISIGANIIYEEGEDSDENLCVHLPEKLKVFCFVFACF